MKKILGILLIVLFLVIPMGAFAAPVATPFATHTMDVNASDPDFLKWRGDYDVTSNPLGGITEVFCIENAAMWGDPEIQYDFYTITIENVEGKYAQLVEATWYANWFVNIIDASDDEKVAAQVAVWNAMGVTTVTTGHDLADELMANYSSFGSDAYVSDWAIAVSPSGSPIKWGQPGQNYLVQNPVPEPATMLLFGIGLIGLAGIGRKTRLN